MKRFQFVWWWNPYDWGLGWGTAKGGLALIYRWTLLVGPLEIRKWERARARPRNARWTRGTR